MATRQIFLRVVMWDKEQESQAVTAYTDIDPDTFVVGDGETLLSTFAGHVVAMSGNSYKYGEFGFTHINDYTIPATSNPGTTEDKARMTFISNVTGTTFSISVPNPIAGCFETDNETVSPATSPSKDLIDWLEANGVTKTDNAALKYQIGSRQRRTGRKEGAGRPKAIG